MVGQKGRLNFSSQDSGTSVADLDCGDAVQALNWGLQGDEEKKNGGPVGRRFDLEPG